MNGKRNAARRDRSAVCQVLSTAQAKIAEALRGLRPKRLHTRRTARRGAI